MEYHELLRKYIERSGLTLDQIVQRLKDYHGIEVSKSYLSQLQSGKVNPASAELNRALADILNCDLENLLMSAMLKKAPDEIKNKFVKLVTLKELKEDMEKENRIAEAKAGYITHERLVQIPLLGQIAAGTPITMIELPEDIEYVEKNIIREREAFALRVKGDSMIGDFIADGDIVICVKQEEVYPHEIAVVAVNGEEATLKRVKIKDNIAVLSPSNPQMQPQIYDVSQIHIIGKVVEVRRRF